MQIKEFLEESGLSITKFAQKVGVTFNQMYYLIRGGSPSLHTALAIEYVTNGKVRPVDFLTDQEKERIYGEKKKKYKKLKEL